MSAHDECGHRWETRNTRHDHIPDHTAIHLCIKPSGHESDITNDDHGCCCGANTWETP